jgi:eukaryotic-like serine/threonine-protein kinase
MSESEADAQVQSCPACGAQVGTSNAEPLARISCPKCGEKFRVERAFDNFVLVETLGVGGMGSVYKARDTTLDRFVALKLLRRDAEAGHTAQLQQEARVTASVNHPHVVKVFSFGSDHGQFYLVMELVDQGSLDDSIEQRKHLPEAEVLQTAVQVAKGLQAAHAKGLIHRDVKPANILFVDPATAKIVDFGLAGAAEPKTEGAIWGTPYYVAPERLNNEAEDFRSDIYSLGGTLFHALAGRPPIEEETNSARKLRELKNQPVRLRAVAPKVSRETSRIIDRMLAPDPNARFASYQELVAQLEIAAQKLAQAGKIKRRRIIITCAAVLTTALTVLGILFLPAMLSKQKAALENASAIDAALQQRYEEARHQLIAGKHDRALATFDKLAAEVTVPRPMLDWIRLHAGLAALLNRQPDKARGYFQAEEKSAAISSARGDRALAESLVETGKLLGTSESIPVNTDVREEDGAQTFSTLLFAFKDFDRGDFAAALVFLEQFIAAQPRSPYAWIADYKPLAQKYLDDLRIYDAWKNESKRDGDAAELRTALANLRTLETRLQNGGRLAEKMKSESAQLASQLSVKEKTEKEAREGDRKKLFEKERPAWTAALSTYRNQIARYDFENAPAAIDHAPVSEPSLLKEKENTGKKAQWLMEWKKRLIGDINRSHYRGRVIDRTGTEYVAMTNASDKSFTVETSYGPGKLDWLKFDPPMLLTVSRSFVRPDASDAADRQWLCAIFANETGLIDEGRKLGEAAAAAKADYRALLPLLGPSGSTLR